AKEYSDDPGSGAAGGELGWASPGDMVPEFENTMANADIGQITAPFQTQFGWHILQVLDTRTSDVGEQMQRNQARQLLYARRFEEELPLWLRKIRSEAYVDLKVDL
ncbi:MAG: peptidylprolyl isomerase, partial [Oceanobacter sp.]